MNATEFYNQLLSVAEEIKDLNEKLTPFGFQITLESNHAVPQKSLVNQTRNLWRDAIDKIAQEQGITKAKAKELYEKSKKKSKRTKGNKSISVHMKAHWDLVRNTAKEKGITIKEARAIVSSIKPEEAQQVAQ